MFVEEQLAALKSHGINPSQQRVAILRYLQGRVDHPYAEQIFSDLVGEMPTLSRTTVYNTLHLFVEKGLLRAVGIDDAELRYDADVGEHAHFKCVLCGTVSDVYNPEGRALLDQYGASILDGCVLYERHLYYRGVCLECVSRNNNS